MDQGHRIADHKARRQVFRGAYNLLYRRRLSPELSKYERWLRCPDKTCCSHYLVYLTGDELVRLARNLAVPPWTFTVALPCAADEPGAFALDKTPQRRRLALARTQPDSAREPACTFLVRASDGAARCGLGAARPAACRAFPSRRVGGTLELETSGCSCDWRGAAPDAEDAVLLDEQDRSVVEYARIIAAWNEYIAWLPDQMELTELDFCRYLLDAYAQPAT